MKKHIPNLITSLNLLCGCLAILFVISGDLVIASLLVILGMFFDFFDGLVARILNVQSVNWQAIRFPSRYGKFWSCSRINYGSVT